MASCLWFWHGSPRQYLAFVSQFQWHTSPIIRVPYSWFNHHLGVSRQSFATPICVIPIISQVGPCKNTGVHVRGFVSRPP
jgi:hypothetical protein